MFSIVSLSQEEAAKLQETTEKETDSESVDSKHNTK
jgi:hypothetical protein